MKNLILVKLGGSLITDKSKPYTLNVEAIKRLSREIAGARKEKNIPLIIAHGGGSFPHTSAKKYKTAQGFINKESKFGFCLVQNDATKLNRIIVDCLLEAGEKVMSLQPSVCSLAKSSRIIDFYLKPIKKLLEYNIIPVPYGDVGIDVKRGCCILSGEEILNYLAKKLKPKKIIIADRAGGVYTGDPLKNPEAKLIPEINRKNWKEIKKYLGGSQEIDVTGGMLHRVERAIEVAKLGVNTYIIDGKSKNNLKNSLLGRETGTLITW